MARSAPTLETLKRLFARSGNRCAFPGCGKNLFNNDNTFIAEICHIEAAESGGERFNSTQTDDQRRELTNLLIMCHEHHKVTDDVSRYSVARLKQIKADHETKYNHAEFVVEEVTLARIVLSIEERMKPLLNSAVQPLLELLQQVAKGMDILKFNAQTPLTAPASLQKLLQQFQEDEPSIKIEAHTTSTGTSYFIRPASADQDVLIAEVSFPNTESGRRGYGKFRNAIEQGNDVEIFADEYIWEPKINWPNALLRTSTSVPTLKLQPNTFLRKNLSSILVSLSCYVGDSFEQICKFGFARLQVLRYGTKEIEFRLFGGHLGADFVFTHRFDTKESNIQFELHLSRVNVNHAIETVKFFEAIERGVSIRLSIDSLEVDAPLIEGRISTSNSALSMETIEYTKELLTEMSEINRILNLDIRYPLSPNQYLGMELKLVFGLITGKTVFGAANKTPIPMSINCREAKELLAVWAQDQTIDLPAPEAPVFTIDGRKIEIPGARSSLKGIRPARPLKEFEILVNSCVSPESRVDFEIVCDQFVYYPATTNEQE